MRYYARRAFDALAPRPCPVDLDRADAGDRGRGARLRPGGVPASLCRAEMPARTRTRNGKARLNRRRVMTTRARRRTRKPPLVLLTGFLGAGKTTTLNRVLGRQHRLRVGVIVNELGRIDIDTRLIKSARRRRDGAGGRLRLSRGARAVGAVGGDRRGRAPIASRLVVLETTGIAEPLVDPRRAGGAAGDAAPAVAAGVVCVVDAEAGGGQLERHEEARAQVEAADRILLTKLDLGAAATRSSRCTASWRCATRPPSGRAFPRATRATAALVPWLLDVARRAARVARRSPRATRTASSPSSPSPIAGPLLAEPLLAVIEGLGAALVRAKGFVHLAGDDRRGFLERAGARTGLRPRRAVGRRSARHRAGADRRRPRRRRHPPPALGLPRARER